MNQETDKHMKNSDLKLDIKTERELNSMIEVSRLKGNLTNYNVLRLKDWFLTCLYDKKYYQLIDFNQLNKIDRHGINLFQTMLSRGICIRLFNVHSDINKALTKADDKNIKDKIYQEQSRSKAVLMFENELLEQSNIRTDDMEPVKNRQFIRANVSFPIKFKFYISTNEIIYCKANVLNISKTGMLIDCVTTVNKEINHLINDTSLSGKELYSINLSLPSDQYFCETAGVCIRENRDNGNIIIGVRFKNICQYNEQLLTAVVHDNSVMPPLVCGK